MPHNVRDNRSEEFCFLFCEPRRVRLTIKPQSKPRTYERRRRNAYLKIPVEKESIEFGALSLERTGWPMSCLRNQRELRGTGSLRFGVSKCQQIFTHQTVPADFRVFVRHGQSSKFPWNWVFRKVGQVLPQPTTNACSLRRDENGNTNNVKFHPNSLFYRCGHTGGGSAEYLDPPYRSTKHRENRNPPDRILQSCKALYRL
jgi:hypothetical protein